MCPIACNLCSPGCTGGYTLASAAHSPHSLQLTQAGTQPHAGRAHAAHKLRTSQQACLQELEPSLTIKSMGLPFDWSLPPVLGPVHPQVTLPDAESRFPVGEPHPSNGCAVYQYEQSITVSAEPQYVQSISNACPFASPASPVRVHSTLPGVKSLACGCALEPCICYEPVSWKQLDGAQLNSSPQHMYSPRSPSSTACGTALTAGCMCRSLLARWRAEDIEYRMLANARTLWARHVLSTRNDVVRAFVFAAQAEQTACEQSLRRCMCGRTREGKSCAAWPSCRASWSPLPWMRCCSSTSMRPTTPGSSPAATQPPWPALCALLELRCLPRHDYAVLRRGSAATSNASAEAVETLHVTSSKALTPHPSGSASASTGRTSDLICLCDPGALRRWASSCAAWSCAG